MCVCVTYGINTTELTDGTMFFGGMCMNPLAPIGSLNKLGASLGQPDYFNRTLVYECSWNLCNAEYVI